MPENKNYGEGKLVYRCMSGSCYSGWETAVPQPHPHQHIWVFGETHTNVHSITSLIQCAVMECGEQREFSMGVHEAARLARHT